MGTVAYLYNQQMPNIIRRDIGDLMNREYIPRARFFGEAMMQSNLVLLYAPRGLGKTWVVMSMAWSVVTGIPFLLWTPERLGKVIIFDGELGDETVSRRFWTIADSSPSARFGFNSLFVVNYSHCGGAMWNLSDSEHQRYYDAEASDCDVIIIDNLLTCSGPLAGRDDDVAQWRRIQPLLIQWREAGKLVILVHHAGKAGAQYGTSLRENIMDTVIALKPSRFEGESQSFEFRFEKTRNVKDIKVDAPDLYVKLIPTDKGIVFDYTSLDDQERQRILELHERGLKPHLIADTLNVSRSKVSRILYEFAPKPALGSGSEDVQGAWHDR